MQTLSNYLKDLGIASNHSQYQIDQRTRSRIEHKFWKEGIDQVIPGYRDQDFTELLLKFIDEIELGALTDEERELIFSEQMQFDQLTRTCRDFMLKFNIKWDLWQK